MIISLIWFGLIVASEVKAQGGTFKATVSKPSCFSAVAFKTDSTFNPPFDGTIIGIRLDHTSGGVTCDYRLNNNQRTNWGCGYYNWWMVQMIKHGQRTYYPTSNTNGVSSLGTYNCPTRGCQVNLYQMSNGYSLDSSSLTFMDTRTPNTVSKSDVFSLQAAEGCCGNSIHDNAGESCADVYFIYSEIKYPSSSPTPSPTSIPTPLPSEIPTKSPSRSPSRTPSRTPSEAPTKSPTYKNCMTEGEIKSVDWYALQNNNGSLDGVPYYDYNMSFNLNSLELMFNINLEYVGTSYDTHLQRYDLGTTYVIDFQSFGTNGDNINKPGSCSNRLAISFNQTSNFNDFWGFSEYPYLAGELGAKSYLSYPPPSSYWNLDISDNACTPIKYNGVFSWSDLSECRDYKDVTLINIVDNNISITLSGTLYVNLVSPYMMGITDSGIYRTFPLIQQDFEISILKPINVLSSTGVDLFIATIIGVYENEIDGSFKLSILTESADYIRLINPNILSTPFGGGSISSVTSSCLVASSYTCGQIFTLIINSTQINCPPADFTGIYQLIFDVECQGEEDQNTCNTFIDDNNGTKIVLEVSSNFIDTTCTQKLYELIFNGNIEFYDDEQFNIIHTDTNNYIIGQDTIYVEVKVDNNLDLDIFDVVIDNVFVCTADDNIDLTVNLNQQNGFGGCLSSSIDTDGLYNVITNGIPNDNYNAQIISSNNNTNSIKFSFLAFDIGRNAMYVHTQLTISLRDENGNKRRLQLLETSVSNQIRHFIHSTLAVKQQQPSNEKGVMVITIILICLFSIFIIAMGFWYKSSKNKKLNNNSNVNKNKYQKTVMSVDDNEMDNVVETNMNQSMQLSQKPQAVLPINTNELNEEDIENGV